MLHESPHEVISTPPDNRPVASPNMPRHSKGRSTGAPPKQPRLWSFVKTDHPAPCFGRYPVGFLERVLRAWGVDPARCLHVCSGGMSRDAALGGVRIDLRTAAQPDILADGRRLPFRDASFAAVCIDPPYSTDYARDLYGVDYPRPSHLLREAVRVVKPGGRIGMLHFLVPQIPRGADFVSVEGVTQGLGYRIRAWTTYRRHAQPARAAGTGLRTGEAVMKVDASSGSRKRDVYRHCGRLTLIANDEREAQVLARLFAAITTERQPIERIVERLEHAAQRGPKP